MRKALTALAVLGLTAGMAHAQSNVAVYGVVDTGYIKETGRDLRLGTNTDNRIGFRGHEDLGGGLKATFHLERHFDLNDGTIGNRGVPRYSVPGDFGPDWIGTATVGLEGDFGSVRLGRVVELTVENNRKFDPFNHYGVGSMIHNTQRADSIDNGIRYDSPNWSGFSFGLSYSLGANTKSGNDALVAAGADNDGWAVGLNYDNGPVALTANFNRPTDSNSSRIWTLAGMYRFGEAKVSLLYQNTNDKGWKFGSQSPDVKDLVAGWGPGDAGNAKGKQQYWLLGLEWGVGPGEVDASVQYFRLKDSWVNVDNSSKSNWKYALGYTYNLSKRTSAYAQASYTKYDDMSTGAYYHGLYRKSVTGFQIGMTHMF